LWRSDVNSISRNSEVKFLMWTGLWLSSWMWQCWCPSSDVKISTLFGLWQVSGVVQIFPEFVMWKPCWCGRTRFWCEIRFESFLMLWCDANVLQWFESLNLNPQNFFDARMLAVNRFLMLWCANAFDVVNVQILWFKLIWCEDCSFWLMQCSDVNFVCFFSWTRSQRISDVIFWCEEAAEKFFNVIGCNFLDSFLMWWSDVFFLKWCSFHESLMWWSRPIDRCPDFVFLMVQWMPWDFSDVVTLDRFFWCCQPLARCSDLVLKYGWCPKDFLMPEKIFWCEFDFILLVLI